MHSADTTDVLSRRARTTPPSPIRKLAPLASAARAEGAHVYSLNIGQPDLAAPRAFLDAFESLRDPVISYEPSQGNEALRRSWARFMNRTLGLELEAEQFLITNGASEALIFAFMVSTDPGDEIVVFDPTYANYLGFAAIAGITLRPVGCSLEHGFRLPVRAEIERVLTPRTRAVLVCNPNNPTGTVYSDVEMKMLLDLCDQHGLFLIADETYREFVYDGRVPRSVLHLAPDNKRVIIVDSLSKRFSLCGARLGTVISPCREVRAAVLNLAQARLSAPSRYQEAAAVMLEELEGTYLGEVRSVYESRRNALCSGLKAIEGLTLTPPAGAFYAVAALPVNDAEGFARFMLTTFRAQGENGLETVFVAPAGGFYLDAERGAAQIRVAFVIDQAALSRAAELLGRGLAEFREHGGF